MTGRALARHGLGLLALLGLMTAVSMARPLLPIDETRYAAVAWEMWVRGDFLVPHLNGQPYHHKPPLLFWLMHAGWLLFGVNGWSVRLISPLFAAGTLALTFVLGRQLWPARPQVAPMAPYVLLASLLFAYFASALMFDAMLSFFVTLGLVGLVRAWRRGGGAAGFVLLAAGLAGALFSKGPVALVHLLPLALLAPWWMREQCPRWRRWYGGVLLAVLAAAALILAWAVPAGQAGGEAFRRAIFWGQTANRMVDSFAHQAPWWYYLVWLPLILAPWLPWPRWWRAAWHGRGAISHDSGLRLVLLSTLFCLVFFSAVSGKRVHYLLPQFVPFALLVARCLSADGTAGVPAGPGPGPEPGRWSLALPALALVAVGAGAWAVTLIRPGLDGLAHPDALRWGGAAAAACGLVLLARRPARADVDVRRVATASVLAAAALLAGFEVTMREPYDLEPVGLRLGRFEREGRPLAISSPYHGQWTLAGRLRQPLQEVPQERIVAWLAAHPQGRAAFIYRRPEEIPAGTQVVYTHRYRGAWVAILAPP